LQIEKLAEDWPYGLANATDEVRVTILIRINLLTKGAHRATGARINVIEADYNFILEKK
jgi:hypothetical protein